MLSALGAINGMILTGTRIYAVWGSDYPALAWLGAWNRRTGSPVAAIVLQAAIAMLLVVLVGTDGGQADVRRRATVSSAPAACRGKSIVAGSTR